MREIIKNILLNHIVENKSNEGIERIALTDLLCKNTEILSVAVSEINLISDKIAKALEESL